MFDFDGVLADTLDGFCEAMAAAFRDVGRPDLADRDRMLALFDDNWYEAMAGAGVSRAQRKRIDEVFLADYARRGTAPAFPGVREMLSRLSSRHTLAVITSNRTAAVESFLAAHDMRGVSQVIGADVETNKVRKIRRVVAAYDAAAGHWYVGDTAGDIVEGRRAGVKTVGAAWGWHGAERLRRASPDFIVDTPAQLVEVIDGRVVAPG